MAEYKRTHNAFFRQLIFIGVLIVTGLVIFDQLQFFIGAFLGAITLYVVFRNIMFRLIDHYKWKSWVASLVIVIVATLIFIGLGYLVFEVIATQIPSLDTSMIMSKMNELTGQTNSLLGFNILPDNIMEEYSNVIHRSVSTILSTTYSFAANVFMMLLILFFMLANSRQMETKILEYQPFKGDSLNMIEREVKNMVYGNAIGIPVIMLAQGAVAWVIYAAYGLDNAVFWAFLTTFAGLIPMVGTALVTVPLGIFLISNGNMLGGVLLIVLGLMIIANVDNLVRIILMNKVADTHPMIVILGVILGIPLFGFWGIIFGPLLISGFLLLIKIYYREYGLISDKTAKDTDKDKKLKESKMTGQQDNTGMSDAEP